MTPTKEMIAMAERIADQVYWEGRASAKWQYAYSAALTAIMEMSEKAADHLLTQGQLEAREAFATGSI